MLKKCILLFVFFSCVFSMNAMSQDWKSLLGNVAKNVIGDKLTTSQSLIGTWNYVSPDCSLKADQLLAKSGGEAIAGKVEEELDSVFKKWGRDACSYTFNADSTYTFTMKKRTTQGTYSFNPETKTITMTSRLGVTQTAQVAVTGTSMSLLFNADKLMSVLTALTRMASKVSAAGATVEGLISNYDGLLLGFKLEKAASTAQ